MKNVNQCTDFWCDGCGEPRYKCYCDEECPFCDKKLKDCIGDSDSGYCPHVPNLEKQPKILDSKPFGF